MRLGTAPAPAREAVRIAIGRTFQRDSIDPTFAQVDDLIDELAHQGYELRRRPDHELPA
jgi:hypothetical protein